MQIDPMTFSEFLIANGDENLAAYLESVDTIEPIPDAFFNPLYEKLKMYYVTGGMPESVLMWTEARDVAAMQEALSGIARDIYRTYPFDGKYILDGDRLIICQSNASTEELVRFALRAMVMKS